VQIPVSGQKYSIKLDQHIIKEVSMLFIIAAILLLCWGGGLFFKVAGGFIHIILVIALVVFLISIFSGHSTGP
jgi:F0F1-type ATP synthase assembly protein I